MIFSQSMSSLIKSPNDASLLKFILLYVSSSTQAMYKGSVYHSGIQEFGVQHFSQVDKSQNSRALTPTAGFFTWLHFLHPCNSCWRSISGGTSFGRDEIVHF